MPLFKRFSRMGSGLSAVKDAQVEGDTFIGSDTNQDLFVSRPNHNVALCKQCTQLREEIVNLQVKYDQTKKLYKESEIKVTELNQIVTASEDEMSRLTAENSSLAARVSDSNSRPASSNQLLTLKQREIERLNNQLEENQRELKQLKQKYKNKVKQIKVDNSEHRQNSAIKLFELKDQLSALLTENESLKAANEMNQPQPDQATSARSSEQQVDSRTPVIIELSEQVSELESQVSKLERQLAKKNQIIEKLTDSSVAISPRQAKSAIAIEAEKASHELQAIESELKAMKRKKRRGRKPQTETENSDTTLNDSSNVVDVRRRRHPIGELEREDPINELIGLTSSLATTLTMTS